MDRSMPGGAAIVERLKDLARGIVDVLDFSRRDVVTNPDAVLHARDLAQEYARLIVAAAGDDLPPLLARNRRNREAASLPDRVAHLEHQVAELRSRLDEREPRLRLVEPPSREGAR